MLVSNNKNDKILICTHKYFSYNEHTIFTSTCDIIAINLKTFFSHRITHSKTIGHQFNRFCPAIVLFTFQSATKNQIVHV